MPKAKGPHGEMIPTLIPDEKNRVFHTTGFSIIAPENWDELNVGIVADKITVLPQSVRQYLESFGTNERDAANSDVGNQLPGKQSTN